MYIDYTSLIGFVLAVEVQRRIKMGRIIICSECGEEKEHEGRGLCRKCLMKKYYEEHKEYIKERVKKWREEHPEQIKKYREKHKEHIKEYNKKYREKHKEHVSEQRRKWRSEHKEHTKEYNKEWCEEHPDYKRNWYKKHPFYQSIRYFSNPKIQFYEQVYRKMHREKLILIGLCVHCGKNPINYSRSVCSCSDCLDKYNISMKKRRLGGFYELIHPEENTSNEVIKL